MDVLEEQEEDGLICTLIALFKFKDGFGGFAEVFGNLKRQHGRRDIAPGPMELMVCRLTPTAEASSCWVISLIARSTRTVFFIGPPS